jgi:hypothetical protein
MKLTVNRHHLAKQKQTAIGVFIKLDENVTACNFLQRSTNVSDNSASFGQVLPFIAVTPDSLSVNVSNEISASRMITAVQQRAILFC